MAAATKTHTETTEAPVSPAGANGSTPLELPLLTSVEALVAAKDIRAEYHDVPEWGYRVRLRGMTGTVREKVLRQARTDAAEVGDEIAGIRLWAHLLAAGWVKEDDSPVLTDEQSEILGEKNPDVVDRLGRIVAGLSGMGVDDDLKAIPSASSSTD